MLKKIGIFAALLSFIAIILNMILGLSQPVVTTNAATGPSVTITNIAINNSSALITFQPVPGAKDYRIYDVTAPNDVKYAGQIHIDTGSSQYFQMQADRVTPVFPLLGLQQNQWPINTSLPRHLDVPSNQIEWNKLGDHLSHTLVIEAVDQLGPVPMENGYNPSNSSIVPLMLTANSHLGSNMGMTHDGKMSTNGQGNMNNSPQVIASSQPFTVTASGSVLAIPSGSDAQQTFFDTFENSERSNLQLVDQGLGSNPPSNLSYKDYTLNSGAANSWKIKFQAVNLDYSVPFIGDSHFMDIIFNEHPGSSWATMAMAPQKNADISGGKVLHLTMEVDRDFDFVSRRWVGFQLAPASDPITNWKERDFTNGEQPNVTDQALFVNIFRQNVNSTLYTGPIAGSNMPVQVDANTAYNPQFIWQTATSGGAGALDKRSRLDMFATTKHVAIFENGSLLTQYDIPNGGLPYSSLSTSFAHYYYHSEAEQPEQAANYPYQPYFTDVYPFSDERHWDNMGFEVLPASAVTLANDFSNLANRAQPVLDAKELCPSGFSCSNIGPIQVSGNQQQVGSGSWMVRSGTLYDGVDDKGDSGRYVYQSVSGGANLSARVTSVAPTAWGGQSGGLMARSNAGWQAAGYYLYVSGGSGTIHVKYRTSQGVATQDKDTGVSVSLPIYLKVSGTGSSLSGQYSKDGVNWVGVANSGVSINLGSQYLQGIYQSSANNLLGQATFDNIVINGNTLAGSQPTATPTVGATATPTVGATATPTAAPTATVIPTATPTRIVPTSTVAPNTQTPVPTTVPSTVSNKNWNLTTSVTGIMASGSTTTFTSQIKAASNANGSYILDVEVYNLSNNAKVAQWSPTQTLKPNQTVTLKNSMKLPAGKYMVKQGVFTMNWSVVAWQDNPAFQINTTGGTTSNPTPTAVPPTATSTPIATAVPPTATSNPTPTATAIPPTATAIPPTATPIPTTVSSGSSGSVKTWQNISPAGVSTDFNNPANNYGFSTIVVDPANPSILYTGTNYQGLYKSTNAGASWFKVNTGTGGAALDSGRLWTLALDPFNSKTIYTTAGYGQGGVLKSTDGGSSWQQMLGSGGLNGALAQQIATNDVYAIALDPFSPNHLVVAFHYYWYNNQDSGVLESLDGGNTWIIHNPPAGGGWGAGNSIWFINNSQSWLVGSQNGGIWRTSNSGGSWSKVYSQNISHGGINSLYRDGATGTLYLALWTQIIKSSNNGASWSDLTSGLPYASWEAIIGDGTNLYTMPAYPSSGKMTNTWYSLAQNGGTSWQAYSSQTLDMGPMMLGYDAVHHIVYSANGLAGVWKLN